MVLRVDSSHATRPIQLCPDPNHDKIAQQMCIRDSNPDGLKREAQQMVDAAIRRAERYAKHGGLDGFALCADYCFNTGPFLSPRHFAEFITPYLAQITKAYRALGFYGIKHTAVSYTHLDVYKRQAPRPGAPLVWTGGHLGDHVR